MSRLLLVEDEIGSVAALRRVLVRGGFDVLIATNPADALSLDENERPEAIVMSGELQGGASAALHDTLSRTRPDRPLFVLGGQELGEHEQRVARPVDGADLLAVLRRHLAEPPRAAEPSPPFEPPPPVESPAEAGGKAEEPNRGRGSAGTVGEPAGPEPQGAPDPRPLPQTPATLKTLAARRELQAAREQAEQLSRKRAEAMAQAAELRKQELAARREVPTLSAVASILPPPPAPPPEPEVPSATELAARLFDDLPEPTQPRGDRPLVPPPGPPAPEPAAPVTPLPGLATAGDLGQAEPARLFALCHHARWTGELRLRQGTVRRSLYWAGGNLVGAASTSQEEQLEALAQRRGLVTREQRRQLRSEGQLGTRRAALLMVERTFLKPAELFPLVQERVEEVAFAAIGGFEGRFELLGAQVPQDERVALSRSPLAVLTEGIRRKYLLERLLAALGGPATLLRPVEEGAPDLAAFALTARERTLAQAVDGLRNVEELLFEVGLEPLAGLAVLHALVLGGRAEIAVRGLAADLAPEVQTAIDLGRVAEKHEQVQSASYFEVLGLGLDATTYEVQQAYERLSREFEPSRYEAIKDPAIREQLDDIQRVLAEARDILRDERLRADYRRHRPRGASL